MKRTAAVGIAPAIERADAMVLGRTAYARFAEALSGVGPDEWARPTDCAGWTVRDLAGHVVGAMRSAASVRELIRQQWESGRRARRLGGSPVDHMTAIQVEVTAALGVDELVAECAALVSPAVAGRRRTPAPIRLVRVPVPVGAVRERWSVGYLVDVILTRDAWMHRIDLCRALGVEPELTADHDGRIVADVVDEWLRRHGRPARLTLTGPAGGRFASAAPDGPAIELDAVEFCRTVSGRAPGTGLLATEVPF